MKQKWSVKALVSYLKLKLDNDFLIQNISVIGEISNFNYHNNRHMYFTLKDETSRIQCVMFNTNARKINFNVKDGMKVNVIANVSVFESSGSLQLYVTEMSEEGVGDLSARFEKLKQDLSKEGLFDLKHKKNFLKYPNRIAVVSGRDSAALNDIKTTLNRRWPIAEVDIYNTLVQGPTAHLEIINNLMDADSKNYDAIILARGGGSLEDLWAFNEEALARVIFTLKTPIVSGVGHEIDFTISDFVSDLRAPTPTAAAELITPDINEVKLIFKSFETSFLEKINYKLNHSMQIVDMYSNRSVFINPELMFNKYKVKIQSSKDALNIYKDKQFLIIKKYDEVSNDFTKKVNELIFKQQLKINQSRQSLVHNLNNKENSVRNKFRNQLELLDSYSPINTLKRGYSIVESSTGIVTSIDAIEIDQNIKIQVSDGMLSAVVLNKEENHE